MYRVASVLIGTSKIREDGGLMVNKVNCSGCPDSVTSWWVGFFDRLNCWKQERRSGDNVANKACCCRDDSISQIEVRLIFCKIWQNEGGMFNYHYPRFISSLLSCLMTLVDVLQVDLSVWNSNGIKNVNIEKVFSNLPPQIPLATMSSLVLSWELADAPARFSLVTGCRLLRVLLSHPFL